MSSKRSILRKSFDFPKKKKKKTLDFLKFLDSLLKATVMWRRSFRRLSPNSISNLISKFHLTIDAKKSKGSVEKRIRIRKSRCETRRIRGKIQTRREDSIETFAFPLFFFFFFPIYVSLTLIDQSPSFFSLSDRFDPEEKGKEHRSF